MREVSITGSLILLSPEAEQLFDTLTQNGQFLEFLSSILDEHARGVKAQDINSIRDAVVHMSEQMTGVVNEVNSLRSEFKGLQGTVRSLTTNGVGARNSAPAPVVNKGEPAPENQQVEVKKVSLDFKSTSKGGSNVLDKFKKMRGKQ